MSAGPPDPSLPDDRLLSLVAVLRDTPVMAPALSPGAWREFLDALRPHGAYALLAYRLGAWPQDYRPPAEVMDFLNRQHLLVPARSLRRAGQPTALYFRGSSFHRVTGSGATVRTGSLSRGSLYASFNQEGGENNGRREYSNCEADGDDRGA